MLAWASQKCITSNLHKFVNEHSISAVGRAKIATNIVDFRLSPSNQRGSLIGLAKDDLAPRSSPCT